MCITLYHSHLSVLSPVCVCVREDDDNDGDNDDNDAEDDDDDFEMPAERRFEVGVRGTPSSGMQYLHLKLHLVMMMMVMMIPKNGLSKYGITRCSYFTSV